MRQYGSQPPIKPDVNKMREAIEMFLTAAGHPPATSNLLKSTPQLVAEAWAREFLDGYERDPASILDEKIPQCAGADGLSHTDRFGAYQTVILRDIHFVGICPHHLLPWKGTAHIAYRPSECVVGYGAIVQVVEALAHRLTLQETLTKEIAQVLYRGLGQNIGVLVVIDAIQSCLSLRGENQANAVTTTSSFYGSDRDEEILWRALGRK